MKLKRKSEPVPTSEIPSCGLALRSNYVAVQLDTVPDRTESGILLPAAAIKPALEGVVVAHGPGLTRPTGVLVPISVKVGDRVLVSGHGQTDWMHGGAAFVLMREPEIMVVVDA